MTASSETVLARPYLAAYCTGRGLDIGCGLEKIVPSAIGIDLALSYGEGTPTVADWVGRWEDFLVGGEGFDYIYSSHLLEDYADAAAVLERWVASLRAEGLLVLYLPLEVAYKAHCQATGQEYNKGHRQAWTGPEDVVALLPEGMATVACGIPAGSYSFYLVTRKAAATPPKETTMPVSPSLTAALVEATADHRLPWWYSETTGYSVVVEDMAIRVASPTVLVVNVAGEPVTIEAAHIRSLWCLLEEQRGEGTLPGVDWLPGTADRLRVLLERMGVDHG